MQARKTSNSGQLSRYKQEIHEDRKYHKNVQVPALEEVITSNECISQDVPTEEVNNQYKTFLSLSMAQKYFHRFGKSHIVSQMVSNGTPCSWTIPWCSKRWNGQIINDCNETLIGQVYVLLNENYVEDDDNMFRFDYRWARQ